MAEPINKEPAKTPLEIEMEKGPAPSTLEGVMEEAGAEQEAARPPESEAAAEPSEPSSGRSGFRVRLTTGWPGGLAGSSVDSPQPAVTLVPIGGRGSADQQIHDSVPLPISGVHLFYTPGKQDDVGLRIGFFGSYRHLLMRRQRGGYQMTTNIHMGAAGLAASFGPFLSPTLEGGWRWLLQWGDLQLGLGGLQASLGVAVASVDMDVTRPDPTEPHERSRTLSLSMSPFYGEVELKLLTASLGNWVFELGLDQMILLQEADLELRGERTGDTKILQWLHPAVSVEKRW